MDNAWVDRWNERYADEKYAYGEEPNDFFKEQISKIPKGEILLPAEGEGRNGVYAARLGWKVSAFDISKEGKKKAMQLAAKNHVDLDYRIGTLDELNFNDQQFDVIGLIYAHFPADVKSIIHHSLNRFLKKGGKVIFEAYSKKHLQYQAVNPKAGGPKEEAMLFSLDEIRNDFQGYTFDELAEVEVELHEGIFHHGKGSVIRFVATKI